MGQAESLTIPGHIGPPAITGIDWFAQKVQASNLFEV